ncbi:hypothetical protein LCGC14_2221100 [marine sediment metagenome]|uniref:Uncharacterized protein n=1 Tax=marine sediment metagenome TaxID=412755 RepID=A0A0F9DYI5_9ZZZZ
MIQIGIEIKEADWAMFYAKFSAKSPMPLVSVFDGGTIPEYKTELEHVNAWVKDKLARVEKFGGNLLKLEVPSEYDAKIIRKGE